MTPMPLYRDERGGCLLDAFAVGDDHYAHFVDRAGAAASLQVL